MNWLTKYKRAVAAEPCDWCDMPLDDEPAGDGTLCADCLKDKHDAMLEEKYEWERDGME